MLSALERELRLHSKSHNIVLCRMIFVYRSIHNYAYTATTAYYTCALMYIYMYLSIISVLYTSLDSVDNNINLHFGYSYL